MKSYIEEDEYCAALRTIHNLLDHVEEVDCTMYLPNHLNSRSGLNAPCWGATSGWGAKMGWGEVGRQDGPVEMHPVLCDRI